MNRPFLSLLAFGVCMMLPELYVRSAVPSDVAVEFGTLKDGQTYAGSVYEGKPPEKRMGNVNLLGAEIRENAKVSKYNLPLVVSRDFSKNTLRWRMAHGYYWCVEIHGSGPSQQSIELSRIGLADIDAFVTGA